MKLSAHWIPRPTICVYHCFRRRFFRKIKSGIKMHTLLDLQGNIPSFIEIIEAKLNDVNILDALLPELGAI